MSAHHACGGVHQTGRGLHVGNTVAERGLKARHRSVFVRFRGFNGLFRFAVLCFDVAELEVSGRRGDEFLSFEFGE